MTRFFLLLILIPTLMFAACRSKQKTTEMETNVHDTWQNPEIYPRNHPQIESIERHSGHEAGQEAGIDGLMGFCERMNEHFAQSNLTPDEATELYELLHASGILFNESVGMPDPDEPLTRESVDDFMQRIALKKTETNQIEIFYIKTSCGFNYFYGIFTLPVQPHHLDLMPKEVWRASVPC